MLKAINISAIEAATIEKLYDNTVLISINQTDGNLFPLQIDRESSKILTLKFDDVTAKVAEYEPINGDQAAAICNFVERNKESNFIIHCAAGVSRSAAIALFIHRYYGHSLKPNYWKVSHPNFYVLGRLISYYEYKNHIDIEEVWKNLKEEDKKVFKMN